MPHPREPGPLAPHLKSTMTSPDTLTVPALPLTPEALRTVAARYEVFRVPHPDAPLRALVWTRPAGQPDYCDLHELHHDDQGVPVRAYLIRSAGTDADAYRVIAAYRDRPAQVTADAAWTTLWAAFDTPVDDDGRLGEAFLHFPPGTPAEAVWEWFDANSPQGVAKFTGAA